MKITGLHAEMLESITKGVSLENQCEIMVPLFGAAYAVGVQWLSGRVLDSRPRGHGFEPHRRHCDVVHEQETFILA